MKCVTVGATSVERLTARASAIEFERKADALLLPSREKAGMRGERFV
jgi:hypothetical protein